MEKSAVAEHSWERGMMEKSAVAEHAWPGEGDDGEVGCSRACMGESPSDSLGGDHMQCQTIQLNGSVIIRVKVKKCEQMMLFIAVHY